MQSGAAANGGTKQASTSSQVVKWKEKSLGLVVSRAAADFGWFVLSFIIRTSVDWIHMRKSKPNKPNSGSASYQTG